MPSGNRTTSSAIGFAAALFSHFVRHRHEHDLVLVGALPVLNVFAVRLALLGTRTVVATDWLEIWPWRTWRRYSGVLVGTIAFVLQSVRGARRPHPDREQRVHEVAIGRIPPGGGSTGARPGRPRGRIRERGAQCCGAADDPVRGSSHRRQAARSAAPGARRRAGLDPRPVRRHRRGGTRDRCGPPGRGSGGRRRRDALRGSCRRRPTRCAHGRRRGARESVDQGGVRPGRRRGRVARDAVRRRGERRTTRRPSSSSTARTASSPPPRRPQCWERRSSARWPAGRTFDARRPPGSRVSAASAPSGDPSSSSSNDGECSAPGEVGRVERGSERRTRGRSRALPRVLRRAGTSGIATCVPARPASPAARRWRPRTPRHSRARRRRPRPRRPRGARGCRRRSRGNREPWPPAAAVRSPRNGSGTRTPSTPGRGGRGRRESATRAGSRGRRVRGAPPRARGGRHRDCR